LKIVRDVIILGEDVQSMLDWEKSKSWRWWYEFCTVHEWLLVCVWKESSEVPDCSSFWWSCSAKYALDELLVLEDGWKYITAGVDELSSLFVSDGMHKRGRTVNAHTTTKCNPWPVEIL
jgi:hypothetical protein